MVRWELWNLNDLVLWICGAKYWSKSRSGIESNPISISIVTVHVFDLDRSR